MVLNIRRLVVAAVLLVIFVGIGGHLWGCNHKTSLDNPEKGEDRVTGENVSPSGNSVVSGKKDDFFAEYRMERERIRGKQIEMLRNIIDNKNIEKEAREAASLRLVQISNDMEREMKTEALVKSKGFEECVMIIQPDIITVVVEADPLRLDKEKELRDLVSQATEANPDKICIIAREPED